MAERDGVAGGSEDYAVLHSREVDFALRMV